MSSSQLAIAAPRTPTAQRSQSVFPSPSDCPGPRTPIKALGTPGRSKFGLARSEIGVSSDACPSLLAPMVAIDRVGFGLQLDILFGRQDLGLDRRLPSPFALAFTSPGSLGCECTCLFETRFVGRGLTSLFLGHQTHSDRAWIEQWSGRFGGS